MSILSDNLILLRKSHGYTQDDLADKVFVTRQAVSKWERGFSTPDIDTLIALSQMYSVSLDDLLKLRLTGQDLAKGLAPSSDTSVDNHSTPQVAEVPNAEQLKSTHRKKTVQSMLVWAFVSLGVYALLCGIIQTALALSHPNVWLVWFTLPVVPPIVFAVRFRHEIGNRFLMFFVDVPFVSGIIFQLIVLEGNSDGAWISFLLIPFYYVVAVLVAVFCKKPSAKTANPKE